LFLPLRDSPNPGGVPLVNYLLIALNVGVFLAVTLPMSGVPPDIADPAVQDYIRFLSEHVGRDIHPSEALAGVSTYEVFVYEHGFRPAHGSLQTLLSSMFLHGGFMHLAGNMLFLWIFGDNVEHRLGRVKYLAAYLLTGAAATLFYSAFQMSSNVPLVGASGAISGVLGFYFLFFPRNTVKVFFALFPFFMDVVTIPARIVLGAYLVLDNLLPVLFGGASGVAHGAHIGGFIAGLGAAWLIDWRELTATPSEYRTEPRRRETPVHDGPGSRKRKRVDPNQGPTALIAQLIRQGKVADAAKVYFASTEDAGPEPAPEDALILGRWLAENGHPTAALTVFRRVIKVVPLGANAAWAHIGAGLVQLEDLGRPTAAYQHFLDAIDLDPSGEPARIARAGLAEIDAQGTS
jgi:membrane associated rhomboid family serine protease